MLNWNRYLYPDLWFLRNFYHKFTEGYKCLHVFHLSGQVKVTADVISDSDLSSYFVEYV